MPSPLVAQLLREYAEAKRSLIMERSGDFSGDLAALRAECEEWADKLGCASPPSELFVP